MLAVSRTDMLQFPAYLSENAKTISAEDNARYANQVDRVSKILAVFEDPSYSDDNQEKNSKIVVLMNEVHTFQPVCLPTISVLSSAHRLVNPFSEISTSFAHVY